MRVLALCDQALPHLTDGAQKDAVVLVRQRLLQPLSVAVAGRVKAGKSTLVNALVGQKVAPTAVEECTRLVTYYSYGVPERVEVVLLDGRREALPLEDGRIPDPLGHDMAAIDHLHVHLSREYLRGLALIDTPGLASMNQTQSGRTEELLMDRASRTAAAHADAVIFLMGSAARRDETEILEAFRALFHGTHASPATAVGVLSRADQLGSTEADPLEAAQVIAARHAEALRAMSCAVIPIAGLLAETVETDMLTERDTAALRQLAALGPQVRAHMLFSHEAFEAFESHVAHVQRRRLLEMLDLYGIRRSLELMDRGTSGAASLERHLRQISGVGQLRDLIEQTFTTRADALKANAALTALTRLAWMDPEPGNAPLLRALRNAVEEIRLAPEMRSISEIWAGQAAAGDDVYLPGNLREDLVHLLTERQLPKKLGLPDGALPEQVLSAAREGVARWRAFANSGAMSDTEERIARVVYRSLERLAMEAQRG